ncbi:MAG: dihydrodipicolinate synthase family protein [Deltaproteobacteria bacterium]|nr:dihydrodipicolinate synthase family protein [Deltaproteobacteria bacterium]MBW2137245.1 dihydrodipicolinate synthase family protein [Deltaproteobacteria bacterium]
MDDIYERLRGIIVPLLTPFDSDMDVDEESLRRLVNHVIEGGVDGIFVMGTTGEFQYLSHDAQRRAIEIVTDEVKDRVLTVAGVTGRSIEETVRNLTALGTLSRRPHAAVVAPLCYHSNRKLPQHMERLCGVSNFPLLLYNNIGIVRRRWKRKDIIPALVGRIAALEGVLGLKDSSGNLEYLTQVLSCRSPTFRVFQGEEVQIMHALKEGAAGAVPSMANILPELFTSLYSSFRKGDLGVAESYQQRVIAIRKLYPDLSLVSRILKGYLRRQGIIASDRSYVPEDKRIPVAVDEIEEEVLSLAHNKA